MNPEELDDLILGSFEERLTEDRRKALDRALAENPDLGQRLAELALQETLLGSLGPAVAVPRRAPSRRPAFAWVAVAGAAALFMILILVSRSSVSEPPPLVGGPFPHPAGSRGSQRDPGRRPPEPVAPAPASPALPLPGPWVPPRPVPPAPALPQELAPGTEPRAVVRETPPPLPAAPAPQTPQPSPRTAPAPVAPAAYQPVLVSRVSGAALRRRGGRSETVLPAMEILRNDEILTSSRRAASFETTQGVSLWVDRGTSLRLESRADGSAAVHLSSGTACFLVLPRPAPFVVVTAEGEAIVTGTTFMLDREERRSALSVLEGSVRFRNEKGEVLVKAGQRSTARSGEKPSAPSRADVESAAAWRLRPELSPAAPGLPYSEHEPGSSRKFPGLVLASPFYEGEGVAGPLARAIAERMDAGLALGHHYRDLGEKTWVNVDRGMEAEVRTDGTLGPETFTDRARKATTEYLDQARQAAGVVSRQPVPVLVQIRTHYLMQAGSEVGVCEAAFSGWDRRTLAGLKTFYGQLLEKHRPATRLEIRFQGVDDAYDWEGVRRTFSLTDADARIEGYMAPRNARNAAVFFLNASFGKRAEDLETYSKILADLIEYLYQHRR